MQSSSTLAIMVAGGVLIYALSKKSKDSPPPPTIVSQPINLPPPSQKTPPSQNPPGSTLPPGKGQEPVGWKGPNTPFCAVNLGWRTPQMADFGYGDGPERVGCTSASGPTCTGIVAYDQSITTLFPTMETCIDVRAGGDANDPNQTTLWADLVRLYQQPTNQIPPFAQGYSGIQAAPVFWFDPLAQRGTYMDWNNREITVDLSSWRNGVP